MISRSDECDIIFLVKVNVEFTSEAMDFSWIAWNGWISQAWVFEFFLLVCFRAHGSHLVNGNNGRSPLSSGLRGDNFKIMKVSDIFHLIQYFKTEIGLEKHNSVKKTVSIYITTCHYYVSLLRVIITWHYYVSLLSWDRQTSQCLESMSEANWKNFSVQRTSYKYK